MSEDHRDDGADGPVWQQPQRGQPESDAYHIWTPRPLLRSVYWKPVPPPGHDLVSSAYEVFIEQRAFLTMHEHVWGTPASRVPYGYLVGDLCEDPNASRRFVIVTSAIPARFDFDEEARDQIPREAGLALRLEADRRRGVLVGWYHRHTEGAVALSPNDARTHQDDFGEPWQSAILFVGNGSRSEAGCFRVTTEGLAPDVPLPFYEMASNESLLARGLKRSYLDWDNYETVDEVRREPRPKVAFEVAFEAEPEPEPEPVPEPVVEPEPAPEAKLERGSEAEPFDPELLVQPEGLDLEVLLEEVRAAKIDDDAEDGPTAETEVEPEPVAEPQLVAKPEPVAEPESELAPLAEVSAPAPEAGTVELTAEDVLQGAALKPDESASADETQTRGGRWNRKRLLTIAGAGTAAVAAAYVGFLVLTGGGEAMPAEPSDAPALAAPAEPTAGSGEAVATEDSTAVTREDLETVGQEMFATISRFYGLVVARDEGRATCDALRDIYVEVEDGWIEYSTQYKARYRGRLPEDLAQRDERMFLGVQDVEREFERSGCPRP